MSIVKVRSIMPFVNSSLGCSKTVLPLNRVFILQTLLITFTILKLVSNLLVSKLPKPLLQQDYDEVFHDGHQNNMMKYFMMAIKTTFMSFEMKSQNDSQGYLNKRITSKFCFPSTNPDIDCWKDKKSILVTL